MIHRRDQQVKAAAHKLAGKLLGLGHAGHGLKLGEAAERGTAETRAAMIAALEELELPPELKEELRAAVAKIDQMPSGP